MKSRLFALSSIFFILFVPLLVHGEDDLNEIAYQNRFLLKAGTILNSEGKGDCLLFPYYDVRKSDGKHQTTEINLQNFGEYGIAAKLRFREGSRGREVFSKDIWIPSAGLWNGRIEMTEDGANAVITSSGAVIWRSDANTFYLADLLSGGLLFSTKGLRKNAGDSTLLGFVEVIGEERTTTQNVDGKVARVAKSEQDCPNTLKGTAVINRVEEGVSMAYDAVAIGNFSRGQGSLFRSPGSPYPRLENGEDTLDQLEFQLSKWEVFGPFSVSPSNQGKTSLIITFPTKYLHYKNGKRIGQINNPFKAPKETMGDTLQTALSEGGQPLPADSSITLPYSVNVIGLYKDYNGSPIGLDNVSLPTYSYESGEVTLTADNFAQRILIEDYEYLQERFEMYRGLPALGVVLREYRDPETLFGSIIPVEFSAVWEASTLETVFIPAAPAGPSSGAGGVSYTYTVSGSASSLGHPIQYLIDWGDGSNSGWLDPDATGVVASSHIWTMQGIFTVSARARCAVHPNIMSGWSTGLRVSITMETISTPTTPTGPTFMVVNKDENYPFDKSYQFVTGGAVSNLGHLVEYEFDWKGDGSLVSGWGSFIQKADPLTIWPQGGKFTIRARARCTTDTSVVSNWSAGFSVTVEAVSAPTVLSGPASGVPNTPYSYSAGGAISNLGHPVQYFFDWGDGTDSGWLAVGVTTASKTWTVGILAGYKVRVRARCATDPLAVSDWTPQLTVNIEFITPPTKPAGPDKGQPNTAYTYTTGGAFSSIGDPVQYFFDWGDGTNSGWLAAGVTTASKTWATGGDYSVTAMARCAIHTTAVSQSSDPLLVKIEKVTFTPPVPSGPTTVTTSSPVSTYTATAVSNIGDPVEIRFFTSDGVDTGWLATTAIGTASFQKTWNSPGIFTVTAMARCTIHTNVTSTSAPLTVTVNNPVPTLTSISPTSGNRGGAAFDVTFTGTKFVSGSSVGFGPGITVNTTTVNGPTQITANITIGVSAATGPRDVTVTNPTPGGGTATLAGGFTVNNPAPTTTSISPTTKTVGDSTFTLTVNGTNFVSTSVVQFNGSNRATTFVNNTQLTANIPATDLTLAGTFLITVVNAAPGGGTSNSQNLTVNP